MACGLSQAEVAALMDLSERAVRAIEHRAIAQANESDSSERQAELLEADSSAERVHD
jgi:DNA-directed RNA polymerase specialized sigma24 family protein